MSTRIKPRENFSAEAHEQMLDNRKANKLSRLVTYHDYVGLGYDHLKAMKMAGLKESDFKNNG